MAGFGDRAYGLRQIAIYNSDGTGNWVELSLNNDTISVSILQMNI